MIKLVTTIALLSSIYLGGCNAPPVESTETVTPVKESAWLFQESTDEMTEVTYYKLKSQMKDKGRSPKGITYSCNTKDKERKLVLSDFPPTNNYPYHDTLLKIDGGEPKTFGTILEDNIGYYMHGAESFFLGQLSQLQESAQMNIYAEDDSYQAELASHELTIEGQGFQEANRKLPDFCQLTGDIPNPYETRFSKLESGGLNAKQAKRLAKCVADMKEVREKIEYYAFVLVCFDAGY